MKHIKLLSLLGIFLPHFAIHPMKQQGKTFSVTLQTVNTKKYVSLLSAQNILKAKYPKMITLYKPEELHMTLLYFKISIPEGQSGEKLATELAKLVSEFQEQISAISFTFDRISPIVGSTKQFIAAKYQPITAFKDIQNNVFYPLVQKIQSKYPYLQVEPYNFQYPDFHISLGYTSPHASIPDLKKHTLDVHVADYQLAKAGLQVSVRDDYNSWIKDVPTIKTALLKPLEKPETALSASNLDVTLFELKDALLKLAVEL
ncbi:MAG: hypothetical protein AB7F19_02450 [Candidatus Babeliales bacterium]